MSYKLFSESATSGFSHINMQNQIYKKILFLSLAKFITNKLIILPMNDRDRKGQNNSLLPSFNTANQC